MSTAMRRVLLMMTVLFCFCSVAHAAQPDIIIIKDDDEPQLDGRIADYMPNRTKYFTQQGVTFTHYNSTAGTCCPDRAGTLTGLYVHNHGVVRNDASLFKPGETIATMAKRQGYRTLLAGKYLNACVQTGVCNTVPVGWDVFRVQKQLHQYTNLAFTFGDGQGTRTSLRNVPGYTTDIIKGFAVDFINTTPVTQPIMAYITPIAPHEKIVVAPNHSGPGACDSIPAWSPPSYNEDDVSDKPLYVSKKGKLHGSGDAKADGYDLKQTCKALLSVDDLVGDVIKAEQNRGRDYIIIYSGDNGMNMGEHRLLSKQAPYDTAAPFQVYAPYLGVQGVRNDYVLNIDVAPTLAELTGGTLGPYPTGQSHPDGKSFLSYLLGTAPSMGRSVAFSEFLQDTGYPGAGMWWSIRTTDNHWHYIEYKQFGCEAYNTAIDPWELNNLFFPNSCTLRPDAGAIPVDTLRSQLHALKTASN